MGITPLVFTGITQFSDDFQTILNRTVAIASLPLQLMQNEQSDLITKKQLLGNLSSLVADVGSRVTALADVGANRALSATTSNANLVSAALNGATQAGSYTITDITSVAKAASETTTSGYATSDSTAVSADGTMELLFGGVTHTIDISANNTLEGLRDAINTLGAGVSASVLNTGTGSDPYYLSITAIDSGATSLELRETAGDSGSNTLTATNQGADAVFKLNGVTVTKSSNTINDVIDGVTLTIKNTTTAGESVDITLSSSRGELAGKLSDLVAAYNSARSGVNEQVGETAGLLSGDFIVREIQNQLRKIPGIRGDGSIGSLMQLGIEFDKNGVMSFNSDAFYALSESDFNAGLSFLDSTTAGLRSIASGFDAISAPVTGLIQKQQDQYDASDQRLNDQIDTLSNRIDFMQQTLSRKLQQADVLLAQLESQQTMLTASIDGMNQAVFGSNKK